MTFIMHGVNAIVESAKYHFTGSGLQYAGDGNIDGSRDQLLGVIHHHHGSVVQVRDTLVILFAFLKNEDAHGLARQHDGFQRVGEFVDVQHLDTMQLRDLVQVEIVGHDLAVVNLGQFDQLHVDFGNVGKIVFQNLDVELRHFLDLVEDIKSAAAAVALQGIG